MPSSWVLSSEYAQIPRVFFFSSLAQVNSHFSPLELSEFLLTRAMTPSQRRTEVRTSSSQSDSYAALTDRSMYSKGHAVRRDCPLRKSRCRSSSIANATNTIFLSAMTPTLHNGSRPRYEMHREANVRQVTNERPRNEPQEP